MLDHLFNAKTGYCHASNTKLANLTGLPITKVQETLEKLESDGAIRRLITPPGGQRWRAIWPATFILSVLGDGVTPTVGATRNPRQVGVQNLSRVRRPRNEWEKARLAAQLRQDREAATTLGQPHPQAVAMSAIDPRSLTDGAVSVR